MKEKSMKTDIQNDETERQADADAGDRQRCVATTKHGDRCMNYPVPSFDVCVKHFEATER